MADNAAPLILLTRPRPQSERFAADLGGLAPVRIIPLQAIVPTAPLPELGGIRGLIFTSENAVRIFAAASDRRDLRAYCVGGRTADTARGLGLEAVAGRGSADALIETIAQAAPHGPLLHLHGRHTRGAVAARLSERGIETRAAEVYDQRAIAPTEPLAPLATGRRVIAPLFSPRSAELLAAQISGAQGPWTLPCLSAAVHAALPECLRDGAPVAAETTSNAMVRLVKQHISP